MDAKTKFFFFTSNLDLFIIPSKVLCGDAASIKQSTFSYSVSNFSISSLGSGGATF